MHSACRQRTSKAIQRHDSTHCLQTLAEHKGYALCSKTLHKAGNFTQPANDASLDAPAAERAPAAVATYAVRPPTLMLLTSRLLSLCAAVSAVSFCPAAPVTIRPLEAFASASPTLACPPTVRLPASAAAVSRSIDRSFLTSALTSLAPAFGDPAFALLLWGAGTVGAQVGPRIRRAHESASRSVYGPGGVAREPLRADTASATSCVSRDCAQVLAADCTELHPLANTPAFASPALRPRACCASHVPQAFNAMSARSAPLEPTDRHAGSRDSRP